MGIIELFRGRGWNSDCWLADYSKSSDGRHVEALFGTMVVPTAYSSRTASNVVQETIQGLNPGYQVIVREEL